MNKDTIGTIATVVITICAVAVTGVVIRDRLAGGPTPAEATATTLEVADWRDIAGTGQRMGSSTAAVTITEFSDFQCPFCAIASHLLRGVVSRHGDRVALVYRHFPLEGIHPLARAAAVASECAAEQGRFTALHDSLFAQQRMIGLKPWGDFAREASVADVKRFEACLTSARPAVRVREDIAAGQRLTIPGTPTILINNLVIGGPLDSTRLERLVVEALVRATGTGRPTMEE